MADQGRWFKLWVSCRDDPSLSVLPIGDFGRWCKLGAYTKEHGTDGTVTLEKPEEASIIHPLQADFQVDSFDAVLVTISRLPNIAVSSVSPVTNAHVSFSVKWHNWPKYQGDFSTDRVRRYREKTRKVKRSKKRGEEKRGEEKREIPPVAPPSTDDVLAHWEASWDPLKKALMEASILRQHIEWLSDVSWWKSQDDRFQSCPVDLNILVTRTAAYLVTDGYHPASKRGLLKKLHNCLETEARKAKYEEKADRRTQP